MVLKSFIIWVLFALSKLNKLGIVTNNAWKYGSYADYKYVEKRYNEVYVEYRH